MRLLNFTGKDIKAVKISFKVTQLYLLFICDTRIQEGVCLEGCSMLQTAQAWQEGGYPAFCVLGGIFRLPATCLCSRSGGYY